MVSQSKQRPFLAKQCAVFAAVCSLSMWLPAHAMAAGAASEAATAAQGGASVDTESGKVSFIDQKNAIVVMAMDGGQEMSLNAKEHKEILDKLQVGDKVSIRYQEPAVTELALAKGVRLTPLKHTVKVTDTTPGATDSGFTAVRTYEGVAEVAKVDTSLSMLTIIDKSGIPRSIQVSDPALVQTMHSLKRRDHIRIGYQSTFTVSIAH